jgi:2-oxoglutarate ferredoxin oxidoreductase subunit beta
VNNDAPIDLVTLALVMGATFVARGFSGDKTQLVPLIRAALAHQGAAVIDVLSPCIAFNNHTGSTKSYDYVREHNEAVNRLDFWPQREEITAEYGAGEVTEVRQHDGSVVRLRKLHADYDPRRPHPGDELRSGTRRTWRGGHWPALPRQRRLLTCTSNSDTVDAPLNTLGAAELCPGSAALEKINASLR